jgi:hypothetical protein
MLKPAGRGLLIAAFSSCLLLAGCGGRSPEPGSAGPSGPKPVAPKTPQLGERMVAAVSHGNSAKALSVHFSLGTTPTANTALPVDIVILPHQKFALVRAHFDSQDGMTVISGDNFGPKTDVSTEVPIEHQLTVMPARAGVFVVNASVETESEDSTVSRVFSIPIIVAPQAQPESPAATLDDAPAAQPQPPPGS